MRQIPKEPTVISAPPASRVSIDPLLLRQLLRQSYTSTSTPALDAQRPEPVQGQDPSLSDEEDTIADVVTKRVMDAIAPAMTAGSEAPEVKTDWYIYPLPNTEGNTAFSFASIDCRGQQTNLIDPTLGIIEGYRLGTKIFCKNLHIRVVFKLRDDVADRDHAVRFIIFRDKAAKINYYRNISTGPLTPTYGSGLMDPFFQPDGSSTGAGHIGEWPGLIAPLEWDMIANRQVYVDEIITLHYLTNRTVIKEYNLKIDKEVTFSTSSDLSAAQILTNAIKFGMASDDDYQGTKVQYCIFSSCTYTDA